MNKFQETLYSDLMSLTVGDESPFYYVDHVIAKTSFRVFNYRLASYTDFLKPNALNCRGTMFNIDSNGNPLGLASITPLKFFNWKENPMTMNLDLSEVDYIMDKMDGSLMTTYVDDLPGANKLPLLKSKTSLSSEQANAAMAYLKKETKLWMFLHFMQQLNYSVSLEWTSPVQRIVVGYQHESLTILEARSLITGEELPYDELYGYAKDCGCESYMVKRHVFDSAENFINSIASITENIEGFVVRMRNGLKMKIKTDAYCSLHHCKDSVTIPRRLYEVVVNEAHDDLRAMFASDPYVLNRIDEFEAKVKGIYAELDAVPVSFFNANKELDRKSYAIKAQVEVPKLYFNIAMSLYLGKEVNFKEFLIKNYKEFGVSDTEETDNG